MGRFFILLLVLAAAFAGAQERPKFLSKVNSKSEFDKIARVTTIPYDLPHVLVLIDR